MILLCCELLAGLADAGERTRPFLIGALTDSWGPTPQMVGLRDGLLALGYRENEQFVLGIRFTQGDLTALPAVAHELVQYGVDLIFVRMKTRRRRCRWQPPGSPLSSPGWAIPWGWG